VPSEAPMHLWDKLCSLDQAESDQALDVLVRHYQFLVEAQTWKFKTSLPSFIAPDDLLSYGQVGLLRAIDRYDPDKGPFRPFATTYVYGAMLDELRSQDWAPRALRREQRLVRQATRALRDESTDGQPSLSAVADHLGWDAARLASTLRRVENSHHLAIEAHETTEDEEEAAAWLLEDDHAQAAHAQSVLVDTFVAAFDRLDEVARYVLVRVYYLQETLGAVAAHTGLPNSVIRKIHLDALNLVFDDVEAAAS
jgi:RNA polymerase sigma factor for flagellar operon FliA